MRNRLTPAIVIVASALVTVSIIAGELALLAKFDAQTATFGLPQLSTATMPDGSILTLHAVSYGKAHTLQVPIFQPGIRWGGQPANLQSINHSTGDDRLVFFVSRHDAETKEFLDFDQWSQCTVTDAYGDEVSDEHPHRYVYSTRSSRSEGRSHGPFPPLPVDDQNYPREGRRIILGVQMTAFRTPANASLDFFDVDGKKLASLPFVSPIPAPIAEWQPESLPATREVTKTVSPANDPLRAIQKTRELERPVSVTLESMQLMSRTSSSGSGQTREYRPLKFRAELREGDQKVPYWRLSAGAVTDPLGKESSFGNVTSSIHEPAWRVTFKATRTLDADFVEDERRTLSGVTILPDSATNADIPAIESGGIGLVPFAMLGAGQTECQVSMPVYDSRGYSSGGSLQIESESKKWAQYNFNWRREQYAGMVHLKMKSELPCLVLLTEALAPDAELLVRTTDATGREVPSHIRRFYDFAHLIFFEAEPEIGELTCEVFLQTPLEFEFFVKPPELETESR